jgi:uncharacterized protein HemX
MELTNTLVDMGRLVPSVTSAVLVIIVVLAFLKHERFRDVRFQEMLNSSQEVNAQQRAESIQALKENSRTLTEAMAQIARELERVVEGQTRIIEAVHACVRRGD